MLDIENTIEEWGLSSIENIKYQTSIC